MNLGVGYGLCMLMVIGWVSSVSAQTIPRSLTELATSGLVKSGDSVYVTDLTGQRNKGRLESISAQSVTLLMNGEKRQFAGGDVREIQRRDSVENGLWIGIAAGVAVAALAPRLVCDLPDPECAPIAVGVIGLPAISVGAIVGALVDAGIRASVYRAPGPHSPSRVTAFVAPSRVGVLVSSRF